jgi:hypothetical protein
MATRQRDADSWLGRLVNELYLGAVVLAGFAVVGGLIAALIEVAIGVIDSIALTD